MLLKASLSNKKIYLKERFSFLLASCSGSISGKISLSTSFRAVGIAGFFCLWVYAVYSPFASLSGKFRFACICVCV